MTDTDTPIPVTIDGVTPNMLRELADSMGTLDVVSVQLTKRQELAWYATSLNRSEVAS